MLNDFFITRDVLNYIQVFITRNNLSLPEFQIHLNSYAPKQHMSFEQWWALLAALEQAHPSAALGLKIGQHIQVQDCGVLGYLFKTSRNVGEALKCFNRFQGLIYAGSKAYLSIHDTTSSLTWDPDFGYSNQLSDALLISAMVNIVRELIAPNTLHLSSVSFTQTIPTEDIPLYEDYFQCPVKQGQAKLTLSFLKEDLSINIPHVDTTLHNILGRQAETLLQHIPDSDDFLARVRDTIIRCLHEGLSDAKTVATEMAISERTLHRRLKTKKHIYRDMLKEIRKSMAVNYLSDPILTLPEVALLLGYSEQSTFSRAFKTWYKLSPLKYQKTYLFSR